MTRTFLLLDAAASQHAFHLLQFWLDEEIEAEEDTDEEDENAEREDAEHEVVMEFCRPPERRDLGGGPEDARRGTSSALRRRRRSFLFSRAAALPASCCSSHGPSALILCCGTRLGTTRFLLTVYPVALSVLLQAVGFPVFQGRVWVIV